MTLPFHPLANVFPLLEGAEQWLQTQTCEGEFGELVADVRARGGVSEPIILYEGLILDGRNRWLAAQAAGVECPTKTYTGDDPVGLVVSLNLRRRHLDTSRRAMAAARLANMRQGERTDLELSANLPKVDQLTAAHLLNVSDRSLRSAKTVLDSGDSALIEGVERGDISVANAAEQVGRGMASGVRMHPYVQRGFDLYETPASATLALLREVKVEGAIWEPANGRGAISRVLRAAGYRVVATDIADYGAENASGGVDFLKQTTAPEGVTTVLTNAPFRWGNLFARHALTLVPRVLMLFPLEFLHSVGRSDVLDGGHLACVYVFRNRLPMMHRDGWDGPRTTSRIPMAWFEWHRDHHGDAAMRRISCSRADDQAPRDDAAAQHDADESTWEEMWSKPFGLTDAERQEIEP